MIDFPSIEGVEFRTIGRFPGYCFGSDGSVWSRWKRNGRNPSILGDKWNPLGLDYKRGYPRVTLRVNGGGFKHFFLHRLILEAFVGPCPEGMEGLHAPDPTPTNCRIGNLRWGTSVENQADKIAIGTIARGSRNGSAKLDEPRVARIKAGLLRGATKASLAREFRVSESLIRAISQGHIWGYVAPEQEAA